MTQEDKQLLIKDLCARLPYNVIVRCYFVDGGGEEVLDTTDIADILYNEENSEFPMYKPYLRPLSSMTKEEENECIGFSRTTIIPHVRNWFGFSITNPVFTDWLNAHHFDHRGLIEKGLALEAPEEMYK